MPMIQIDVRCQPMHWQSESYLHELDLEAFERQLNYWLSDTLRHEFKGIGIEVFDIEVRRYK